MLLSVVAVAGCGRASADPAPLPVGDQTPCPEVPTYADGSWPRIAYVTWILDGRIAFPNQRQLRMGSHMVQAVDSLPEGSPVAGLRPDQIESVEILLPSQAEEIGICPGVAAIVITTREGDPGGGAQGARHLEDRNESGPIHAGDGPSLTKRRPHGP